MQRLAHYGLHRMEGDIALLVQQNRQDNVLGIPLDVDVKIAIRRPCTHQIDINDTLAGAEDFDDPLFHAMLPFPKISGEPTLVLDQTPTNEILVNQLLELTSPNSFGTIFPFWIKRPEWYGLVLRETNIQPLVITQLGGDRVLPATNLANGAYHSPRRLIILAPPRMVLGPNVQRIETKLVPQDLQGWDLRAVGAGALRQHMFEN